MDDETFTKKIWSVYPKTMIGRAQKKQTQRQLQSFLRYMQSNFKFQIEIQYNKQNPNRHNMIKATLK